MEERSLFEVLKEGFDSALAWTQGKTKLRVTQFRDPGPPPHYQAADVQRIREVVHMSQAAFAKFLGVSRKTVASWEQGARIPSTGTARLLQLIEDPQLLDRLRVGPAILGVDEVEGGADVVAAVPIRAAASLEKAPRKPGRGEAARSKSRTVAAAVPKTSSRARPRGRGGEAQ